LNLVPLRGLSAQRLRIPYREESHVPVFHVSAGRRHGGGSIVPVLNTGDAVLSDARQVVDYYEALREKSETVSVGSG
jgi:hypothetical protein